ncbi:MAG: hydantoinase B/oxoprolinase [Alphaproteobacteria bacterium]|nr:MAG: hydantoinase B/oxoprolinase [Alphaproteobacteria bacterium]
MLTDPVTLEILSHKFSSVTDEIGYTIKRIAHSLYIREAHDFTSALVTNDGRVFAYPSRIGVSLFVDQNCGSAIKAMPDVQPGDVIITNHPYLTEGMASHLPDLHLLVPYFHEGQVICYGWLFAHFSDVGGRVPGSLSPSNADLFQEGLQIPPVKLYSGGEFVTDILAIINCNSRTPSSNTGDIRAMISAALVAQERISQIIARYGIDAFLQSQADLIQYSAQRSRDVLRRIPDGVYEAWDYMDDDLLSDIPLRLRLKMTVSDGLLELDFSGTDPQTPTSYNIPSCGRRSHWFTPRLMAFILTHDRDIPRNSGLFEPISVVVPQGTVLNPEFPAAVGLRATAATRLADVIQEALFRAAPDLVPAAPCGTAIPIVFSEFDAATHRERILIVQWCDGGSGARRGMDGIDGRGGSNANMSNNPIETVEDSASVVIEDYALRSDSGGPGRWRGGVGITLTFRVLCDGARILARNSDRFRFAPWGASGGRYSSYTRTVLNMGTTAEREVGKIDMLSLNKGDRVTVMIPGGGGYGDPFERNPEATRDDVARGLVSVEGAARDYGVVIVDGGIDFAATARRRAERQSQPAGPSAVSYDPQRLAWESVCDDKTMNSLVARLENYPAVRRWDMRRELFAEILPGLQGSQTNLTFMMRDPEPMRQRLRRAIAVL